MISTTLTLIQDNPLRPDAPDSIEVTLLKHDLAPRDFGTDAEVKTFATIISEYSAFGGWRLENSLIDSALNSYTIGNAAPQKDKYWGFSPKRLEVDFFERQTMSASETETGIVIKKAIAVTLYAAWYGPNGLTSSAVVGRDDKMNGTVRIPSAILRPGTVRWDVTKQNYN